MHFRLKKYVLVGFCVSICVSFSSIDLHKRLYYLQHLNENKLLNDCWHIFCEGRYNIDYVGKTASKGKFTLF